MVEEMPCPVTFGIIVLNGEPFIRYQLEALYPFATRIVVVEGAVASAAVIASSTGHSVDGTLAVVKRFMELSDPGGKVTLVTAETEGRSDGFWREKTEMSQAFARRAVDGWLWQIDVDEFYQPGDMKRLLEELAGQEDVHAVSFTEFGFWGSPEYFLDGYAFRTHDHMLHRLFRWKSGCSYVEHRPPTVVNEKGRDLRSLGWWSKRQTQARGIRVYHYDMVFPVQAERKSAYYGSASWHTCASSAFARWHRETWESLMHPFWIYTLGDHFSWLRRFGGSHPLAAARMFEDVSKGEWEGIALRPTADIEKMLDGWRYRLLLPFVEIWTDLTVWCHWAKMALRSALVAVGLWKGKAVMGPARVAIR